MHEIECECGKVVRGQSMAQARNNLKNHRVSHGDYNRLRNRIGGFGGVVKVKPREYGRRPRNCCVATAGGRSSAWIAKMIGADVTSTQVWNFTLA